MKKITTSALFLLTFLFHSGVKGQTTHPFELGFNAGAAWEQSDVRMKKLGGGGGFTFGQMYLQDEKHALDWGWRFRYLNAITYGQDSKRSYGIMNNAVLNGVSDTTLDYYNNGGFVYQNYKTTLNELSLELVIGANRLRNAHKVYPYIFGGAGITKAVAKTDMLNANNMRYDFVGVDSAGTMGSSDITSSLNNIYDGSYETTAEGSKSPKWRFMPSLGVGLGYQVTPGFSIGLEHKMTWALSDQLDGQQWANDNTRSTTNDKYHYTSVWLKFSFGRAVHSSSPDNVTTNNNTSNIVVPSNDKPVVNFTSPSNSPFTSSQQSYTVKATVTGVSNRSGIVFNYNGVDNTNFNYDAVTHQFSFPVLLLSGNNSFMITATNASGNGTANATVIYEDNTVITPPAPGPVVTITNPGANPYTTVMNNVNVNATILNVASQSQIGVTINGVAYSGFIFNPSSHVLNISTNVAAGANTFVISATNSAGSDSKSITVIYNMPAATPPPVVTIVNPAVNPFTSVATPLPINAVVNNVTAVGQISASVNGGFVPSGMMSFNPGTGALSFNSALIAGANTITIGATNVSGADSKTITVIYSQPVVNTPAPVVTISSPSVNPFNTSTNIAALNATVLNVASVSQIFVTLNGAPTSAFTYNPGTKQLAMTVSLIPGANVVNISATNSTGSDSKSATIIYNQPAAIPAPVVTITSPASNPYNSSSNSAVVHATVLNISTAAQIAVNVNGIPTTAFTYNLMTKQLSLNVSLIAGANVVTISASSASGSDSKSQTIIYNQPVTMLAPVVTITSPAINPFTTASASVNVSGTVLNVSGMGEIAVTVNGSPSSAFTFNAATHQINVNAGLVVGANVVVIAATNAGGSDSKTETVIYDQPAAIPAPVVTITSPAADPYNTTSNTASVNASVLNVTGMSEIAVSINGTPTSAYSYNTATKALNLTASLISGANTITIAASNASGSDSKSRTIIYTAPVVIPAPVVTITSPTVNPFNTSSASAVISAKVLNVSSSSQIAVSLNGTVTAGFSYSTATNQLTYNASLISGGNIITITATNTSGSDSKSITVLYTPPAVVPAPVVTFTNPVAPGAGSSVATYNVEATVTNVIGAGNITVTVNGIPTTAFTYNLATKVVKLTAALVLGNNTIAISAVNPSGSDSKSVFIKYKNSMNVLHPDTATTNVNKGNPNVHGNPVGGGTSVSTGTTGTLPTIVYGVASPYTTGDPAVTLTATVNDAVQTDITVKVNGVVMPFTYTLRTKSISFTANLNPGSNSIVITATNASGPKSETLIVVRH
ncbi:MAG: beta strand repeat-containing protein [Bacteroidia bacterium]